MKRHETFLVGSSKFTVGARESFEGVKGIEIETEKILSPKESMSLVITILQAIEHLENEVEDL